ncbi:hypothetical protein [Aurantiacibacter gilvus]|uniref:Uracil-DNA glycosylase-like domain-containing protein n=1 Tax=Aurantiacibacter gilvus TaxID=3139141 RepID=A0ABU9IDY3_9SPHN
MENRPDLTADLTPDLNLAEQFAAAQDWWRDAGVDQHFTDEVQVMLAEEEEVAPAPVAAAPAAKPAEPEPPKLSATDLPDSLDAFHDWWTGEANPFAEGLRNRVAPRGAAGSSVMVLVPMPEAGDGEALLAGPQGRFIANVLRSAGIDAAAAYFASALPGHMPLPDWARHGSEGLGIALAHHVGLVKPQRVIMFGSKLPALFGHDPAAPPEMFDRLAEASVLATFAPDRLLDHARQRARLWKRLLEWT